MARYFASLLLSASCILAAFPSAAMAADDPGLESGLVDAMRLNKKTKERIGDSGKAIQAFMREGVVNKRPNQRFDYTDYYLVNKPAKFMGHDLVLIEEEYMSRFIGCCVNAGLGVTLRIVGGSDGVEKFADENGCTFTEAVDLRSEWGNIGLKFKVPPGHYATLSCRERDASR